MPLVAKAMNYKGLLVVTQTLKPSFSWRFDVAVDGSAALNTRAATYKTYL
jgi:hypothetical protein